MDLIDLEDADLLSRVLASRAAAASAEACRRRLRGLDAPGILGTTRVLTSFGHVPAHLVRVGDTLKTRDGSFVRVERITDIRIDEDFLARHPEAAPVIFRRNGHSVGSAASGCRAVARRSSVSVGPNRFEDRLVPAAELSRERGGSTNRSGMMVYFRFHLGREAQINCDGIWVAIGTETRR
jgi:hypothetical protein